MTRIIFSIGAAAVLAACAKQKPANEPGPTGQAPQSAAPASSAGGLDLDALAAREATGLSEFKVVGPKNGFTATVRASGPPKVSQEGKVAIVEIPIGSSEPISCQVVGDVIDAGGTVAGVLANAASKVEFKRVAPWAIEVIKEVPTSFVHAVYVAQSPKGKVAGELKLAVNAPSESPIVCVHDEFGYEKTFVDDVKAFCGSIQYSAGAPAAPGFVDISIAKIKDAVVGFSKATIVTDGAKRRYTDTTTLLIPALANELRAEDDYSVEVIDSDLRLESGTWVQASAGHIDVNVQVKRTKGGSYHYAGEVQGKKVEGDFKTKDGKGLPSNLSIAKELAVKAKGDAPFSFEAASYHPGLDPTAPMVSKYFRDRGDPPSSVHEQIGKTTVSAIVDEFGLMKKGEMPIGSVSLTLDRAFVRGKP